MSRICEALFKTKREAWLHAFNKNQKDYVLNRQKH